jgi:isopentenyldiphosphate isomerase
LGKLLPIVNRQDQEIGLESRSRIHELLLMHRTVHVLLFNPCGRLYLQKRSFDKEQYPGVWTSSASGHVEAGESYSRAALRELREELGLILPCRFVGKITPQPVSDNAFAAVYWARTGQIPVPDIEEIAEGDFFSYRQAWTLARDRYLAAPVLKLVLALAGRRGLWRRFH